MSYTVWFYGVWALPVLGPSGTVWVLFLSQWGEERGWWPRGVQTHSLLQLWAAASVCTQPYSQPGDRTSCCLAQDLFLSRNKWQHGKGGEDSSRKVIGFTSEKKELLQAVFWSCFYPGSWDEDSSSVVPLKLPADGFSVEKAHAFFNVW